MRHSPPSPLRRSKDQDRASDRDPPPTFGVHSAEPWQSARAPFRLTDTSHSRSETRCDWRPSKARESARLSRPGQTRLAADASSEEYAASYCESTRRTDGLSSTGAGASGGAGGDGGATAGGSGTGAAAAPIASRPSRTGNEVIGSARSSRSGATRSTGSGTAAGVGGAAGGVASGLSTGAGAEVSAAASTGWRSDGATPDVPVSVTAGVAIVTAARTSVGSSATGAAATGGGTRAGADFGATRALKFHNASAPRTRRPAVLASMLDRK